MRKPLQRFARCFALLAVITTLACDGNDTLHWQPPQSGWVIVTDETGGQLILINPDRGRVEGRLAVGKRPRGLRISTDGTQALVALSGSPIAGPGVDESTLPPADRTADGLGVVDLQKGALVRMLSSGADPETFDISPDGALAYVSNEETAEMSVIDLATGSVRGRVAVGPEPEGVTVTADGSTIYVTCEGDNTLYVVDASSLTVRAKVATAARPRSIAVSRDGALVLVAAENGGVITRVDGKTAQPVGEIKMPEISGAPMPPRPMTVVFSADERQAFVSLGRASAIAVVDVPGRRVDRIINNVGARPWGLAINAAGTTIYTANGPSADVAVINVAMGAVVNTIDVGGSPWGVAVIR